MGREYKNYGRDQINIEQMMGDVILPHPQDELVGIPHNLPRTHIRTFVGREAELAHLHTQLKPDSPNSIVAIEGMGGMGKTELALQYALSQLKQETYCGGICWLRARESDVGAQIVSFARTQLGLNIPESIQQVKEQVGYCWSRWREGEVLLILDDLTDYRQVQLYLPSDKRFKVLITTRLQLGKTFQPLDLQVLDEDAALELLRTLTTGDRIEGELESARSLCKWLGYLPLGLELVGRYLERKPDLALVEMQERLETKRLNAIALKKTADGMTAQLGVAAAFELSWQELDEEAQRVCYLLSLFALAPVDWMLVEACLSDSDSEELEEVRDSQLVRLSLLQRVGQDLYVLHQLIWEFFRAKADDWVKQEGVTQFNELKLSLCQLMAAISSSIPQSITLSRVNQLAGLMPHMQIIGQTLTEFYADDELIWAFEGVARFYRGQGMYGKAETWSLEAVEATQIRLGEEHLHFGNSLNNLALLYFEQGRYREAEPLFVKALKIFQQQELGDNHPNVTITLNNLASLYQSQGRYEQVEPLHLKVLEIRQQQLGENHLDIANPLTNLADFYSLHGRYEEAEPLFLKALEIRQQQLSENHPDVATTFDHLASLYQLQGRYGEAEPLFRKALKIRQQQLSENHPDVATSLNSLASLYQLQGLYEEAEPFFLKALEVRQQQLGEGHPHVAESLNNLANCYYSQKRYEEAEPLFLKASEFYQMRLGDDHPNVANTFTNLANLYQSQGRYEEAEPLYFKALKCYRSRLGEEHPFVASSLNNIASFYYSQKRYEDAEPLCSQALKIRQQKLGKNHPDVAASLTNLATIYQMQGRYQEAEPLYSQSLKIYQQQFGENHLNVVFNLSNLAVLYCLQGRYEEAELPLSHAFSISERLLGENHSHTIQLRKNIQFLRQEMNR